MKNLRHKFALIKNDLDKGNLDKLLMGNIDELDGSVEISDELIRYLSDTLKWVKSYNPFTKKHSFGLNLDGITVIDNLGIETFSNVLNSWIVLFRLAPDAIELRGDFILEGDGYYEILKVEKAKTLSILSRLLDIVDKSNKDKCIIHFGV